MEIQINDINDNKIMQSKNVNNLYVIVYLKSTIRETIHKNLCCIRDALRNQLNLLRKHHILFLFFCLGTYCLLPSAGCTDFL